MNAISSQRDGFALAAAIMALVLVGALVTGGFVAASHEGRASQSSVLGTEAQNIAEYGMEEVVGTWTVGQYAAIPAGTGSSVTTSGSISLGGAGSGAYDVTVSRLGGDLFMVQSTGRVTGRGLLGGASRTLGMVVRTSNFSVAMDRAVQVNGPITVSGNAKVDGTDRVPSTWKNHDQCSNLGVQTGIVARDTSQVKAKKKDAIIGDPPKREDPNLPASADAIFGDYTFEDLASMATFTFPHGTTINNTAPSYTQTGACNESDSRNWGAPKDSTSACHFFFPIIYAEGDLKLNSNASGQGILLVEGDLHIAGGYEFYGIIVVKGSFETGSGNARIYGTTIVFGETELGLISESTVNGTPIVSLSSCAIDRAVNFNSEFRARPIVSRAWIDLTGAGVGN
jgi:hypothetical protein